MTMFLAAVGGGMRVSGQSANIGDDLQRHNWQIGVFAQGGFVPDYRVYLPGSPVYVRFDLDFYNAGVVAGRESRDAHGFGLLRGRGEVLLEATPFWLARYPDQSGEYEAHGKPVKPVVQWHLESENFHGASVTPFLLRWNFEGERSRHVVPWLQLGGGLLWTNHKFPMGAGGTSVINFMPQVAAGVNVFHRSHRSVDLSVKAIHISNASLGDHNPGLNQTLQFAAGYSWWR
jgi:hypothetical protein